MRIIFNRFIPFKGYIAINLFGFVFIRKEHEINACIVNHEMIHSCQMKELLYIFFYLWYIVEYIIRLCIYRNKYKAYMNVVFEREAYYNQHNYVYTHRGIRKLFSFFKYYSCKYTI